MGHYEETRDLLDKVYHQEHLIEMAALPKELTGLPVNIWIDDGLKYLRGGHGNRIKFQNNRGNLMQANELLSMSVEDTPKVFDRKHKIKLSSKQVAQVKEFVIRNKSLLDRLGKDLYFHEFINQMWTCKGDD